MSETTLNPLVLKNQIVDVLSNIYDPEIPVNIYELGLIYDLQVDPEGQVAVKMTLTTPHCPVAGSLPGEVQEKIKAVPGVKDVNLELVWDPPWDMGKMSEAAKLTLGLL
jgi:FeS assembly SUF system protein